MYVKVDDILERLSEDLPIVLDIPSPDQQYRAMTDAANRYQEDNPREYSYELVTVPGQAEYPMPANCKRVNSVENFVGGGIQDADLITPSGIIPNYFVTDAPDYAFTFRNGVLTLFPTPTSEINLFIGYSARIIIVEIDDPDSTAQPPDKIHIFEDLELAEGTAIYHKAMANLLILQSNFISHQGWRYNFSDEGVDKQKLPDQLRKQAQVHNESYDKFLEANIGQTVIKHQIGADSDETFSTEVLRTPPIYPPVGGTP